MVDKIIFLWLFYTFCFLRNLLKGLFLKTLNFGHILVVFFLLNKIHYFLKIGDYFFG